MSTRCPPPADLKHLDPRLDLNEWPQRDWFSMVALLAHNLPDPSGAPLPIPALTMMRSMPPSSSESSAKHLRHLLVVIDVERGDRDGDAGMTLEQFGLQLVEPVGAAGTQRQVTALRGETRGPWPAPRPEDAPVIRIFCRVTALA